MSEYGALVEWLLQAKAEVLGRQPVPLPLCLLQIPHDLDWDRILVSALTVMRLITWYMERHRRGIDRSAGMAFVSRGHESDWLLTCTYFFRPACSNAIYFRTLSIAQAVRTGLSLRITGCLVNNGLEICGKSRSYYNLRHFPSVYMDRLKKTTDKVSTALLNSNQTPSEYKWQALYLGHVRWFLQSQIPLTCHWFCSVYVWQ